MNRPFSLFPDTYGGKKNFLKRNSAREVFLWILFHLSIPLLFLLSLFFIGPVNVNTSLFDMLPKSYQSKEVIEADSFLSERNGRQAIILCAARDFSDAKRGAVLLYDKFFDSSEFTDISFYFDFSVMEEFRKYLFDYRFVLAGSDTVALLESGRAEEIAYDALASAFAAFNFYPLDNIDKDPFFLAERRMGDFLSSSLLSGAMTLTDDVIASRKDGKWYVMLRMTLAPHAVTLQAGRNVIGRIYSAASEIKEAHQGIEFYFSGIPFHSYESSSGAQREVSIISTITLLLVLMFFLCVFRSALPVFLSIIDILISLGISTAAALLIFREIHIITFVFGTTLIGTCVDYSVHFFVHWKGNAAIKDGEKIRAYIIKNITMSFISTQACFIIFLLAPFPILKQFAVFSMTGLLSSYLTFFCIYPRLKIPPEEKRFTIGLIRQPCRLFANFKKIKIPRFTRAVIFTALIIAVLILFVLNLPSLKIENNISSLYTMSDNLLESEIKTAQVMDYGSPGWYFIVSGANEQETLENEENLIVRLNEEITKKNLDSYLATTIFVPSEQTQRRTYNAMTALLPLVNSQFEYLGFPEYFANDYKKEFDASQRYCHVQNAPSLAGISNLWIGAHGGKFYSCVIPLKPADESVFRSIAGEFDYVHFINKTKDISADMDTLTRTMLVFFLVSYIIVSVIIFFVYPLKDSLKICSVPVLLALAAAAVLADNNIPIGFFSIAALVLVFGLSLDYIFFMSGKKNKNEKNITLLGVIMSFLTTLLSFGALSLSGFMPVHLFGLTVCAALSAAFISAIFLQEKET